MSAIDPNIKIREMIRLCIDKKVYGTIWTKHIVRGNSIEHQDKGGSRPSFRSDNPRQKRFFNGGASSRITRMYSKKKQVTMIDVTLKNKTANDAEKIDGYNSLSGKPIIDK